MISQEEELLPSSDDDLDEELSSDEVSVGELSADELTEEEKLQRAEFPPHSPRLCAQENPDDFDSDASDADYAQAPGPAIIEEYSGTTLLPPGWTAQVTRGLHLWLSKR